MDIEKLLQEMTLEEKAGLCSGADFWRTKAVERLGLPAIMVSDGPHGLRTEEKKPNGEAGTMTAVCFPSGAGIASSFDTALAAELGDALGKEALAVGVHTVLGPAINIKRSPLCGRNFEYMSEDPCLAGEMAAAYTNGVQANGVGVSVKHFAANNQEYRRMNVSTEVSEQALREIYLAAFETVVKKAHPWTVMCSYNQINGVYSCENPWLLDQVLRKEWGFDGIVMSDWGAMNRRVDALKAGLELEMPSSRGENDKKIVAAVKAGTLDEAVLDMHCRRLLQWIEKALAGAEKAGNTEFDHEKDSALSEKMECECAVLLKNDGTLPLKKEQKLAVIGGFAKAPRYQGGGSSHIRSSSVTSAWDVMSGWNNTAYAEGFGTKGDEQDEEKLRQAVEAARGAETAVIFAGLPDSFESEGYDRKHLELPACQNRLIAAVAAVQPHTVVVLHNGSPVTMPWLNDVAAVLELYLGGQSVGGAAAKLLCGEANPSGKLAETFPVRLADTPAYLDFANRTDKVRYGEGVFVGYRWYDAREMQVLFPFGYGLSYTTFVLSDLRLSRTEYDGTGTVDVTLTVKNTGAVAGKEVVQLYVAPPQDGIRRPLRELRAFCKVALAPGEEKTVTMTLDRRAFAYYEEEAADWFILKGIYTVCAGTSSRELPLQADIAVDTKAKLPLRIEDTTTCGDLWARADDTSVLEKMLQRANVLGSNDEDALGEGTKGMLQAMMEGLPLHSLLSFGGFTAEDLKALENSFRK